MSGRAQGNSMTSNDASRIQSSQAKSGGNMSSSGFAARAQSAAANNNNNNAGNASGGRVGQQNKGGSGKN